MATAALVGWVIYGTILPSYIGIIISNSKSRKFFAVKEFDVLEIVLGF